MMIMLTMMMTLMMTMMMTMMMNITDKLTTKLGRNRQFKILFSQLILQITDHSMEHNTSGKSLKELLDIISPSLTGKAWAG